MRNFQLIDQGDALANAARQLLHAANKFGYWEKCAYRHFEGSPHRDAEDMVLRYQIGAFTLTREELVHHVMDSFEVESWPIWKYLPQVRPLVFSLMSQVNGVQLGRVMLTRLGPKGQIAPHRDEGRYSEHFDRYHVPLQTNDGCNFYCGGDVCFMHVGQAWWFNNQETHWVSNHGEDDRIHLIIDVMRG